MSTVYHYAPATYLERISESGELKPSNAGGSANERPALWFSTRQTYEPTALKPLGQADGSARLLSFTEMAQRFGAVRFGISADDPRLLPWVKACAAIGITRDQRRTMERYGRKLGANPDHWFAILAPVDLDEVTVDLWHAGTWVDVLAEDPTRSG